MGSFPLLSGAHRWFFLIVLLMWGLVILAVSTRLGVGTSPDSAVYIGAADNLLKGKGLTVPFGSQLDSPMTQFPPLYSLLLSLFGLLGLPVLAAARLVNAILLVINSLLVYFALRTLTGKKALAPLVGSMLLIVSPSYLLIHQMAWSEPFFLALLLAALLVTVRYLQDGQTRFLAAAAGLAGLAALTRLVGVAYIGAIAIAIVLLGPGSMQRRIGHSILFGMFAVLPLVLWLVRNQLLAGTAVTRSLAFHPVGKEQGLQLLSTLSGWLLLPASLPTTVKAAMILLLVVGIVTLLWTARSQVTSRWKATLLFPLLALGIVVYSLFLMASISFLDANTPLDERILIPVYVQGLIIATALLSTRFHHPAWLKRSAVIVFAVFVCTASFANFERARTLYWTGGGFNSPALREPLLVEQIARLPFGQWLYSNSPEAIYLQTGRPVLQLPRKFNLMTQTDNPMYASQMKLVQENLEKQGGLIVYFSWVKGKTVPTETDLNEHLPLQMLVSSDIGKIFVLHGNGN